MPRLRPHQPIFPMDIIRGSVAVGNTPRTIRLGVADAVAASSIESIDLGLGIPGLVLWLDASETSSITTSTGGVRDWADLSGSGYTASQLSYVAQRPQTGTRTQNGLNVIEFDGGDLLLVGLSWFSLSASTTFIVMQADNSNNAALLQQTRSTASAPVFGLRMISSVANFAKRTNTSVLEVNLSDSVNIADASPHLLWVSEDSSAVNLSTDDGTPVVDGSPGAGALTVNLTTIGGRQTGGPTFPDSTWDTFLTGWIGEIRVYDNVLSTGDRNTVVAELESKWGL